MKNRIILKKYANNTSSLLIVLDGETDFIEIESIKEITYNKIIFKSKKKLINLKINKILESDFKNIKEVYITNEDEFSKKENGESNYFLIKD